MLFESDKAFGSRAGEAPKVPNAKEESTPAPPKELELQPVAEALPKPAEAEEKIPEAIIKCLEPPKSSGETLAVAVLAKPGLPELKMRSVLASQTEAVKASVSHAAENPEPERSLHSCLRQIMSL